jgi:DNA-binding SARP family transcriptional activator
MVESRKAMPYLIRLLGPAAVEGPSGILSGPISQRHRLALLAILCRAPRKTASRDRLIALLWPEADRLQSRRLLNAAAYSIRQVLGKDALLVQGEAITLAAGALESDVERFECALSAGQPEEALRWWGGAFLEGLALRDGTEFEGWIEDERAELERSHRRALDGLAQAALAAGRLGDAADWLKRRLAREPTDSRVTLALMRVLERLGERAAAIQLAATHSSLLRYDLGAEPDPTVEELAAELRRTPSSPSDPRFAAIPPRTVAPVVLAAEGVATTEPAETVDQPGARASEASEVAWEGALDAPALDATPVPTMKGWIRIGPRPARASTRGGALRGLAVAAIAVLILVTGLLGSSPELIAALQLSPTEADVVVFPLRARASPEFSYMGEVIAEDVGTSVATQTLLRPLEPERLRELLDGPQSARQERTLGERLARRLWITGTVTQVGDSLLVRILVHTGLSLREAAVVVPARHQHTRELAAQLVGSALAPEVRERAVVTRKLVP